MNWFDTSGLTSLAKTALKEAQKTIDKALDIQDESGEEPEDEAPTQQAEKSSPGDSSTTPQNDNSDFFSSWGLTVSAESAKDDPIKDQPVVTESPSKTTSQSMWGSFAGSFFEQPKDDVKAGSTIVRPPKAKSMNLISDVKYGSQEDLFSKSQLVMSDGPEGLEMKMKCKDDIVKDDRRSSTRSNRLSLMSSRNSSDSVEVLSQSMKTTPDSEAASGQSMSHSSSVGQKLNSESVEVLPDSLVSPSSIECLGFDSYSSDKNSSTSSNLSPGDLSDKKATPVGEHTEKVETADSISLVADDDEDTVSYNSVSECTAPTVLDTDEKPISPFQKTIRIEPKKGVDKEFIHLEQSISQKMHLSENSSNDGSWSDRTLNADNDSIILEAPEEQKKDDQEDLLMERLSDSSSFYNVTAEMSRSDTSAFVNIEKHQCSAAGSSESSQKDCSVKERTSPISSDSKSDLVKIGSDRTSGHTSGDELETTTSSDIEIIPSPNGESHGFRNSPAKYALKQGKFDGTTSPNLVDLVLGKSLATKIRGHNRELSEASVQSNTSDESQCSETDRLMRRLCEMAEILEARESRLMEVSRSNAELAENNADLKTQVESLLARHEGGDITMITEDYTQRMSALEKKFQQAIREKDQLRKQLDTMKSESSSRKNSLELENAMREKDDVISQLQEEGEKLAKQQLQHSNIIKKLRAKEKDNEQVIKSLRDKISELTAEVDRMKRAAAAKEEHEVSQIEAVYRLTTANGKMEAELLETKSLLSDTTCRLESALASLEAARAELDELRRSCGELQRLRGALPRLEEDAARERRLADQLRAELQQLRKEMVNEEKRWLSREQALRQQVAEARELLAGPDQPPQHAQEEGVAALLSQLATLQRAALHRDKAHQDNVRALAEQLNSAEALVTKVTESEKLTREENARLTEQLNAACDRLRSCETAAAELAALQEELRATKATLASKTRSLEELRSQCSATESELQQRAARLLAQLEEQRAQLDTERKRYSILQEQMSRRGDLSPTHSVASDSMSLSSGMWPQDESSAPVSGGGAMSALCVEEALSALTRRDGERRATAAALAGLQAERDSLRGLVAGLQAQLDDYQGIQEQYDALLQMYGEKEEQLEELKLDLQDVTQLYKAQLDELIALRRANT